MRRLLLLMMCAVITAGTGGLAARKPTVHQKRQALQGKLKSLHQQKASVKRQIRMADVRKRTWAEQLRDTQSQLGNTRRRIQQAELQLMDTRSDLAGARAELDGVRARLRERQGLLNRRLVATQRHGSISYAAVMLDSADYWDYLSRKRLVGRLVDYDVRLVDSIRSDERDVLRLQIRLLDRQAKQRQLAAVLADQRARREALVVRQANQVREAAREKSEAERQLAALERSSAEVTAFLRRLVDTPAGRARAATPYRGGWILPVNGRISSPFGMRMHPVLQRRKLHTGVDFAVPAGTPIHATGSGVVVHAGWWGAYGNAVIVDHGGGTTTLYGHMSAIRCSAGQAIQRGAVVGLVGSTGWSTGPHCHYEVRVNGVPVNPLGR